MHAHLRAMSTGDLKNNLKKFQAVLKAVKYDKDVNIERYLINFRQILVYILASCTFIS